MNNFFIAKTNTKLQKRYYNLHKWIWQEHLTIECIAPEDDIDYTVKSLNKRGFKNIAKKSMCYLGHHRKERDE